MIRAILALLFAVLYLILGIPVLFVEWIIRKCNRHAADISSLRMVQWAFRVIMFICGVKLTVIGEENVPKDVPVLYIGNHRSYFDIIITYSRCPRLTGYIAKDTMGKVPLLNIWMKRLYCLFLDRTDMKKGLKTILTGIDQIKTGISMCIFPEGTRSREGNELGEFKGGSFKCAMKAKCPIIPVAIIDSYKAFDTGSTENVNVQIHYLEPITYDEYKMLKTTEVAKIVKEKIKNTIDNYATC